MEFDLDHFFLFIDQYDTRVELMLEEFVDGLQVVSLRRLIGFDEGEYVVFASLDSVVEGVDMWCHDDVIKEGQ
jgi:hypothetical protein